MHPISLLKKPTIPRLGPSGFLALLGLSLVLGFSDLRACTLWAAVVPETGGTIISKNRDWKPDHTQVLKLHRDDKGYAYFGLYAVGNDSPGLKEGVNEKGLCVVSASASSIPKKIRVQHASKRGSLMRTLLTDYATCDQVLADAGKLFAGRGPSFLLISDRTKIITLEVGLKGRYSVKVTTAGHVAHTNHYLDGALADCNIKIGASSDTRFRRISELLQKAPAAPDIAAFAAMSKDQAAGPDNSLWRTAKSSCTLSSWILETPAKGSPRLRVVVANPGEPEVEKQFVLDQAFWGKRG